MTRIVTFGEIMLRLSPPDHLRFTQARSFDVIYGGGESNVAVSLSNFGLDTEYVTRLPRNDLGDACLQFLRQYCVGMGSKLVRKDLVAAGNFDEIRNIAAQTLSWIKSVREGNLLR
jgi:sugar/nucleoside kinase (ribokinase family)